jgi:hypothetical protein
MPGPQSDYPLTLAEVLFAELKSTRPDLDETQPKIVSVKARLMEIQGLTTEGQVAQICQRDGITIKPTAETAHERIWDCRYELSKRLVPELYTIIRGLPQMRSALCLSGGGVRSAIFNLGILQGLARCGLLDKFDYLSTVSGGGFIASWLSAWIHRENGNVNTVVTQLAKTPDNPLETEPKPLYNLRVYANYLTPKKGLLSVDTWTLIAIYLRNLLLNWMVFVPVIMAFLILPRIWFAFVKSTYWEPYFDSRTLLTIGFLAAAFALGYIGTNLPGGKLWNFHEGRFVRLGLCPLLISAMALTTYWFRLGTGRPAWWRFIVFALALGLVPWIFSLLLRLIKREWQGSIAGYVAATALILVAFSVSGFLIWYVTNVLDLHERYFKGAGFARVYASLAVPFFLVLLTIGGTFIAGFTSRFTDVDDQEWWARSGAWILIVVVGWSVFHLLVLFGPVLLVGLQVKVSRFLFKDGWTWENIKGVGTAAVGIISGAITLFGGSSSKTPAHGERDKPPDWKAKFLSITTSAAAVVFAAFIVILLALLTNRILASNVGRWMADLLGAGPFHPDVNNPRRIVYVSPGRVLVVFMFVIAVVGWLLGRFINTNRFSLHYYWRNRMMRAYLGVSRNEQEREKTRNKFTDFDLDDNVFMHDLKQQPGDLAQKPLHVVNVTLNLAGGEKLEWQDRKAESFTISPLHSGSYWLGYRDSAQYGGKKGISLATSVAISGAAASPNMGYMMTSPVVRFIMTLFNVRLGFWLGNPRKETFKRDSPTQSVRPIFDEALGKTDDQSPYIYLSDGGHFDNFGLYEMILRRSRFIIVSDASTDPDYCFESLAYAIRQVRVDFGVPIEFRGKLQLGKNLGEANKYCAIADIRYSCVDKPGGASDPDYDGVLIYIKPSLDGSEPADVLNFHESDSAFPQDTIVDQWFGEAQFESYRMLGSHMIAKLSSIVLVDKTLPPFKKIEEQAKLHLGST